MSERIDPLVLSNDCAAAVVAVLDVPSVSGLGCALNLLQTAHAASCKALQAGKSLTRVGFVVPLVQALSLSACSKSWRQLVLQDERLWQAWAARDLPPSLLRAAAAAAATGQSSWRAAYEHATRLQSLRRVAWSGEDGQHSPSIAGRHPRPREGRLGVDPLPGLGLSRAAAAATATTRNLAHAFVTNHNHAPISVVKAMLPAHGAPAAC